MGPGSYPEGTGNIITVVWCCVGGFVFYLLRKKYLIFLAKYWILKLWASLLEGCSVLLNPVIHL